MNNLYKVPSEVIFFRDELRIMNIHYMHKIKELNNEIKMQEKIINKLLVQNENLRNK